MCNYVKVEMHLFKELFLMGTCFFHVFVGNGGLGSRVEAVVYCNGFVTLVFGLAICQVCLKGLACSESTLQ